jgi:hypothetical protein
MKQDTEKTTVIFRKFRQGDIIALFPMINADNKPGHFQSYQHIGQHGAASRDLMQAYTIPARDQGYRELKAELENIGYNLDIKKRVNKYWWNK